MGTPSPQEDRRDPPPVAAQRALTKTLWDLMASFSHDVNEKGALFRGAIGKSLGMDEEQIERASRPFPGSVSSVKVSNVNWPLAAVLSTGLLGGSVLGYQALKPDSVSVNTQTPQTTSPLPQPTQPPTIPPGSTGEAPGGPSKPVEGNPDQPDPRPSVPTPKPPEGTGEPPKLPPPVSWDWRYRWWIEEDGSIGGKMEPIPSKPGKQPDEPPDIKDNPLPKAIQTPVQTQAPTKQTLQRVSPQPQKENQKGKSSTEAPLDIQWSRST